MVEFYAEAGFTLAPAAAERTFGAVLSSPSLGQAWLLEYGGEPAGFVVLTGWFSLEYGGLRGFIDNDAALGVCRAAGFRDVGRVLLEIELRQPMYAAPAV
jgi:hypothetical protein